MAIFRDFRALVAAVRELVTVLQGILDVHRGLDPALDRLEALERARAHFEAEMDGKWLQADGKLKAAKNAEARERALKRSYENQLLDPLPEVGDEGLTEAPVFPDDVAPSEAEGVPPLHLDVAPSRKARAVRAKFGI